MRVRMAVALAVVVVAGSLASVQAQEARRARLSDPAALRAELGLSDEQAAEVRRLWADRRKQAIRQRADLAIARLELEELMNAPVEDRKAIDAKVKAVADLQAARLEARTEERLAMRRILTPEQQQKMRQLARERRAERGPRAPRARRGRPGRPGDPLPPAGPGGPWSEGMDEDSAPVSPEPEG